MEAVYQIILSGDKKRNKRGGPGDIFDEIKFQRMEENSNGNRLPREYRPNPVLSLSLSLFGPSSLRLLKTARSGDENSARE